MSNKYPVQCIGHKAAGTEQSCKNLTGLESGRGRKNPFWCPDCDEKRIAKIDAEFNELVEKLMG